MKTTENQLLVMVLTAFGAVLMHVEMQGNLPKILRFLRLDLDPSITDDERRNAFTGFLSSLGLKEYPRTAITWSDGMTYRQLNMPDMPMEDLEKALIWDLKKKYYSDPEENYYGFSEVMKVEGAEGPEKLFNVFYCDKKVAEARFSFVQELGLEIRSLAPAQAALATFASKALAVSNNDVLICEIEEAAVHILVARDNHNMLVRQVVLGVQASLLTDEGLNRIVEEIKKTIDFYESQKYYRPVTTVMLTGRIENAERVHQFLSQHLGTKVVLPDMEPYLSPVLNEEDKGFAKAHGGLFAAGLGTVLLNEEEMNLVPETIKSKNRERQLNRLINRVLIGTGVLLLVVTLGMLGHVNFMKERVKGLNKQYQELELRQKKFEDVLRREKVRRTVFKGTVYSPSLLKEISFQTPAGVTLNELQYDRQAGMFVLRGDVHETIREDAKSMAQYVANLSESQFFNSCAISSSSQDDENKALHFEIRCVLKGML